MSKNGTGWGYAHDDLIHHGDREGTGYGRSDGYGDGDQTGYGSGWANGEGNGEYLGYGDGLGCGSSGLDADDNMEGSPIFIDPYGDAPLAQMDRAADF